MPLPVGIATVTVTGTLYDPDGPFAVGCVDFTPTIQSLYPAQGAVVVPARVKTVIDAAGKISVTLTVPPAGATYHVAEQCEGGTSYDILLLASNGPVQDLSVLAPVTSSTGTPVVVGPRGPQGWGLTYVDNLDGTFTLTSSDTTTLTDSPDGTFTLTLAAA